MENLDRIVADTLAQSGFETPVYLRPIPWSRWFRCESSFSLLLVPSAPGLYALAEEVAAPGETPSAKRMLAVFDIGETDDLCVTLSRHFAPRSPLSERLSAGRCFVRFAQLRDAERRRMVCNSLKRWLAASAQTANGLPGDSSSHDIGIARDFAKVHATTGEAASAHATSVPETASSLSVDRSTVHENLTVAPAAVRGNHPLNLCHPGQSEAPAERSRRTPSDFASSRTFTGISVAGPAAAISTSSQATSCEATPEAPDHKTESPKAAAGDEPPPLPSGF
jgi:hypothetical protein